MKLSTYMWLETYGLAFIWNVILSVLIAIPIALGLYLFSYPAWKALPLAGGITVLANGIAYASERRRR